MLSLLSLHRLFPSCGEQWLLSSRGARVSRCGGFSWCRATGVFVAPVFVAPRLQSTGSLVVVRGFSCSAACGIFLNQSSNPCLLHWHVDFLPLSHQGSPLNFLKLIILEDKIFKLYYAKFNHYKSRENR